MGFSAKPVRGGLTWGLKIMSGVFIIRAEKAREKAEILKAKAEIRDQRSEVRGQTSAVGDQKQAGLYHTAEHFANFLAQARPVFY
jgi:hypothetical protein